MGIVEETLAWVFLALYPIMFFVGLWLVKFIKEEKFEGVAIVIAILIMFGFSVLATLLVTGQPVPYEGTGLISMTYLMTFFTIAVVVVLALWTFMRAGENQTKWTMLTVYTMLFMILLSDYIVNIMGVVSL